MAPYIIAALAMPINGAQAYSMGLFTHELKTLQELVSKHRIVDLIDHPRFCEIFPKFVRSFNYFNRRTEKEIYKILTNESCKMRIDEIYLLMECAPGYFNAHSSAIGMLVKNGFLTQKEKDYFTDMGILRDCLEIEGFIEKYRNTNFSLSFQQCKKIYEVVKDVYCFFVEYIEPALHLTKDDIEQLASPSKNIEKKDATAIQTSISPEANIAPITSLSEAIERGDAVAVQALIDSGADVNNAQYDEETPLIVAIRRGNIAIIDKLIEAGANVNHALSWTSPLIEAVMSGRADIVQRLINKGADPNFFCREMKTALICAVGQDDVEIIDILIKAKANINFQDPDSDDETALMKAARHGSKNAFDTLLKAGADFTLRNREGQTVFDIQQKQNDKFGV